MDASGFPTEAAAAAAEGGEPPASTACRRPASAGKGAERSTHATKPSTALSSVAVEAPRTYGSSGDEDLFTPFVPDGSVDPLLDEEIGIARRAADPEAMADGTDEKDDDDLADGALFNI